MRGLFCVAFLALFFTLCVDSGSALKCYSCSSLTGHKYDCEVKVSNKTIPTVHCNPGYTACMTLTMKTNITRACAVSNVCQLYRNTTGFKDCSTCVTDLCNGSTVTSLSMPLGLLAVLFAIAKMTIF